MAILIEAVAQCAAELIVCRETRWEGVGEGGKEGAWRELGQGTGEGDAAYLGVGGLKGGC